MRSWSRPYLSLIVVSAIVVSSCTTADVPVVAAADVTVDAIPTPTTSQTAEQSLPPTVLPTPVRASPQVPENNRDVPVELWFPKDPESYEDFTAMFAVQRTISVSDSDDRQRRIATILDLWVRGPNEQEITELGFVHPLPGYVLSRRCADMPFGIEFVKESVLATFCQGPGSPGVGADARITESFRQTLAATGVADAALLTNEGQQCFGGQNGENPLGCLSAAVIDAVGPGFPCPVDAEPAVGTISGVDDWVNARIAPSLEAGVVGRFNLGQTITFYGGPASRLNNAMAWVAVAQPNPDRCVYVAAQFITTSTGPLDQAPTGITYDLPQTGAWVVNPRAGAFGRTVWVQLEGFSTAVSIAVTEGKSIDEYIARQEQLFDELDYDVPVDWYEEIQYVGADRAIRPITIFSESGDVGTEEVLLEVGEYTISATTDLYIKDVETAPLGEMLTFLQSIEIDRELFLATMSG